MHQLSFCTTHSCIHPNKIVGTCYFQNPKLMKRNLPWYWSPLCRSFFYSFFLLFLEDFSLCFAFFSFSSGSSYAHSLQNLIFLLILSFCIFFSLTLWSLFLSDSLRGSHSTAPNLFVNEEPSVLIEIEVEEMGLTLLLIFEMIMISLPCFKVGFADFLSMLNSLFSIENMNYP